MQLAEVHLSGFFAAEADTFCSHILVYVRTTIFGALCQTCLADDEIFASTLDNGSSLARVPC